MENCSKFWFQPTSECEAVAAYVQQLNQRDQDIFAPCTDDDLPLNRTTIYVARNHSDDKFYRARLVKYDFNSQNKLKAIVVRFIDTGCTQKCELADIFVFTKQGETLDQASMPPRCFPCRLAEIQPSTSNISGGYYWNRESVEFFKEHTTQREVKAEVISTEMKSFLLLWI